eukprot:SAG22_NODE_490_length_9834_cov_7.723780_1_plen_278_part_00
MTAPIMAPMPRFFLLLPLLLLLLPATAINGHGHGLGAVAAPLPPPPICTWNTSAQANLKLPGCCGYDPGSDWQADGCSCGCCKHNFSGAAIPAVWPPAGATRPGGRRPSTARFLSFYNECPVDLPQLRRGQVDPPPQTAPPLAGGAGAGVSGAPEAAFESLPLLFGMCMAKMPDWGCWRDQLDVVSERGSAAMLSVRGSGTLVCGSAPISTLHLCADNCSDLDPAVKPMWNNASGCGMRWLSGWLDEVKPKVHTPQQGRQGGLSPQQPGSVVATAAY